MKKSKAVTLALIGTAVLFSNGCGRSSRTFYDKNGAVVPRSSWKKADGTWNELYDAKGNPIPASEIQSAYSTSSTSSGSTHRSYSSGGWFFGGPSWGSSSSRGPSIGSSGGSVSRGGFGSTGGSSSS